MAIRFTALALAAALVSAPAFAAPAGAGMSATVRFGDLDLATDAGATSLRTRIKYAARAVCGGEVDQRDLTAVRAAQACRQVAMASAEPQMQLALSNARSGHQLAANDMKVSAQGF